MSDKKTRLVLDDWSGGRNGSDPPLGPDFAANQVVEAVDGDWYRTRGFRKRHGSSLLSMTGSGSAGPVSWLGRHVPGTNEADAELWAADEAVPTSFQRLDNSATWTTPTVEIDVSSGVSLWDITSASFDGKFFMAFNSPAARLHCYDPAMNWVRRTGIAPGANAPTVANTGGGAYAATLRYYRVRFYDATAVIIRQSEPTPSVSFTPSGAGAAARVSKPTTPADEYITGWSIEASTDNVTFYNIANVAIATLTFDDTLAPAVYNTGPLSALTGSYSLQKSYRFIAADQNRLVGFGSYTATDRQNRVEFSAVLGSRDVGDAERVDTTTNYYLDLDEKDSGVPTGLIGPLWGNYYAFKSRQWWELSPTGDIDRPFRATAISKVLGSVASHAACIGEDTQGNPCLYSLTHRGLYRYGVGGLTYIGRGVEDLMLGPTNTMNMAATKVIGHMVYHADKRQLWVWFASGSSNDPNALVVLDVRTGGWSRFTGLMANARCSVLFADTIGASMGFQLKPYIGTATVNNQVVKCDNGSVTADNGTPFQTYLTTRPLQPRPGYNGRIGDLELLAPAASGVTITATVIPDFGAAPTQTGSALLTAAGAETRVSKRLSDTALSGAEFVQLTIGDASAVSNAWSLDRVVVPIQASEAVSA